MTRDDSPSTIRTATGADLPFIRSLSPVLAGVIDVAWHADRTIRSFQDAYIDAMMVPTDMRATTFVAVQSDQPVGFINVRERTDEISGERAATVPLLAVSDAAQGSGVGRLLIEAAETWTRAQGFRLLHLEVFASNSGGMGFYRHLGFQQETINMIKPLT